MTWELLKGKQRLKGGTIRCDPPPTDSWRKARAAAAVAECRPLSALLLLGIARYSGEGSQEARIKTSC